MTQARILVAGTHSGAGKTTIATGLMAALRARGLRVQGFKVGPDFIDPTFHQAATGRKSRNLDGWMLSRETVLNIVSQSAADADAIVVEGVMGLFDGKDGASLSGTTAEMALWLDAAVVLVVDAAAMAGSAAAIVHGFDTLEPSLRIAAVLPNRIASARHYDLLRTAIEARCRPHSIGYLPRDPKLNLPERHLGLHLAQESLTAEKLAYLASAVEQHVDLDKLLELAARTPFTIKTPPENSRANTRIGIARDAAFCFYYQDNLDLLEQLGAELVEFSPVSDAHLPAGLDGLYLGGGYPELHLEALAANTSMRQDLRDFIASDRPAYAECGGFMYLTEAIVDADGREFPMVGIFPTRARMQKRLAKLGYVEVELHSGERARGHEFRYSNMDAMPADIERAYKDPAEGYRVKSCVGSYIHLHFLSCPAFAERFVQRCGSAVGEASCA